MKRRIVSMLLSVAMMLSLLSGFTVTVSATGSHSHRICYNTTCTDPAHAESHGEIIVWEAWEQEEALPDEAGSYYLTKDVKLPATWTVTADIQLDLNGHTIALDDGKTGSVIKVSSTNFTLCDCVGDGEIAGGNTDKGGGVYVNSGKFSMYGGNITGNRATTAGSGVYIDNGKSFYMYGGSVIGNTTRLYGRSIQNGGTFQMYGGTNGGTWGGVDWSFTVDPKDGLEPQKGILTIAATSQDENTLEYIQWSGQPSRRYNVGEWPVGANAALTAHYAPYDVHKANIRKLVILENVTSIGSYNSFTFGNVTGELRIPSTCTYIGQEAFVGSTFTSLVFAVDDKGESDMECIAQGAFKKMLIEEVVLPKGLKCIHAWIFQYCNNLKKVTIQSFREGDDVAMWGTKHHDYENPNIESNSSWNTSSSILADTPKLETVILEDAKVKGLFFGSGRNGNGQDKLKAFTGNTAYTNLQSALDAAAPGDTVDLIQDVSVPAGTTIVIPENVTLNVNGKTLTNNGTLVNFGIIKEENQNGKFNNNGNYADTGDNNLLNLSPPAITLTACAISYNLNGGTIEEGDNPTCCASGVGQIVLIDPVKKNAVFNGWYTTEDFAVESLWNNGTDEVTNDITFYAKWIDKPAQAITFDTTERYATYGDGVLEERTATAAGIITYTSSDDTVATVDGNGVVTVLNAGTTFIAATVAETEDKAETSVGYTLTVSPRELVITADSHTISAGQAIPELTYDAEGFLDGDSFRTEPVCTTTANGTRGGSYAIVLSGADAGNNYSIIYVNGTLTVRGKATRPKKKTETVPEEPVKEELKSTVSTCTKDENCLTHNFADLNETAWYHDGIHFCMENGLMSGVGNDKFDPSGTTTRGMLVTILWNLEGKPIVNYAASFEDVDQGDWYSDAIRWAASEGIVSGYGDKEFGPKNDLTREQFVTIMHNYAKYKEYDVSVGEETNIRSYGDAADVVSWAVPATKWACGSGLISGIADGNQMNLKPQGDATRAQAATILYHFCEKVANEK